MACQIEYRRDHEGRMVRVERNERGQETKCTRVNVACEGPRDPDDLQNRIGNFISSLIHWD